MNRRFANPMILLYNLHELIYGRVNVMQKKIDKIMPLVVIATLIIFVIGMVVRTRAGAEQEDNGEQYQYEAPANTDVGRWLA